MHLNMYKYCLMTLVVCVHCTYMCTAAESIYRLASTTLLTQVNLKSLVDRVDCTCETNLEGRECVLLV